MSIVVRRWALLALLALVVVPVESLAASRKNSTHRRRSHRVHRRQVRRLPPGGVVWARNAVVMDPATNEVFYEKNAGASVPIASLSKLMTAMVFLEQHPDLDRVATVTRADLAGAGHTQLRHLEEISLHDLLHMSLMCSDNAATRILARESGLSHEGFLGRMNAKAAEMGLSAHFVEFTGLDERNVASANSCARLLHSAASNETIQRIMTTRVFEFEGRCRDRRRGHVIVNTNRLLGSAMEIRGGKTGFIVEAGYCFATWIHTQGRDLIAVVLGAPTPATRFADVRRLVQRASAASEPSTH